MEEQPYAKAASVIIGSPADVQEDPKDEASKNNELEGKQESLDDDKEEETSETTTAAIGKRNEWDFTDRRVMVKNVLKFLNARKSKKMVQSWETGTGGKVKVSKFKKPPTDNWIIVTLASEDQVPILLDYINNNNVTNKKGEKLTATRVGVDQQNGDRDDCNSWRSRKRGSNESDDKQTKRQRQEEQDRRNETSQPRVVTDEEVKDATIPLWRCTYKEQIQKKEKELINKCAVRIVKEIKDKFRQLDREAKRNKHRKRVKPYRWLNEPRAISIESMLPSKSIVRNKCEFTFGYRYVEDESESDVNKTASSQDTTMAEVSEEATATSVEKSTIKAEDGAMIANDETASTEGNGAKSNDEEKETPKSETDDNKRMETTNLKKIPSIGAMTRGWSGCVAKVGCCRNIPSEAVAIADIVEKFLGNCPMPPYNSKKHCGFWRTLTVRSSRRTKECMLIFVHAPLKGGVGSKDRGDIDNYSSELFESEKSRLLSMLTEVDLPIREAKLEDDGEEATTNNLLSTIRVTSIYFQEFDGLSMPLPEHPVQHVYGEKVIKEKLGKCIFQISPGAFFQVVTESAEVLYDVVVEKVRDVTDSPEETICFDVCCGTGTIGLTLMKEGVVGRVVGVDISAPAIDDAKVNADLNGYSKSESGSEANSATRFVAARAEHVLHKELQKIGEGEKRRKVVAVVDPAREGLHNDVVRSLRGFRQIDRIVYVSCNPTGSLIKDAALLCTPESKRYKGRPFRPTYAQPVDMFPYSNHSEMVMVFDRLTDEEMQDGQDQKKLETNCMEEGRFFSR